MSVIIPTHNRCDLLRRTLQTVFTQSCKQESYEVIVVVDGSADGTLNMLRLLHPPCRLRILQQPNLGQAAARNAGLAAAIGDLVLFLDDDMLCEPNLIAEHIAAHQSAEDQLVHGAVYVSSESPATLATCLKRTLASDWIERLSKNGHIFPLDATAAPNVSAKRKTLIAFKGFDEDTFRHSHEDMEFGIRLWCAGVRNRFCRTAVTHEVYTKSSLTFALGDGAVCGRSEVKISRKYPFFRRHSQLGHLASAGATRKFLRKLSARFTPPIIALTAASSWLAEQFPRSRSLQRMGLRFLWACRNSIMLRNAVSEAGGWKVFEREFGALLPVLLYHHVEPDRETVSPSLTISPEAFEKHIRWLQRCGYVGIRCSDWAAWLRGENTLPRKPVLLTFDGASSDIAGYALPILYEYGFSATVFVVTSQIGGSMNRNEDGGPAGARCMTAEEMRDWAGRGFEFGSLTRTHLDLRDVDGATLLAEMEGSAMDLSDLLCTQVRAFAYPCGYHSHASKKVAERKFDLAFTRDHGLNELGTDPWLLRRITVRPSDTLLDLGCYVRMGHTPLNRLRHLLHSIWQSPSDTYASRMTEKTNFQ